MKNEELGVEAYSRDDQTKLATGKLVTIDNQIDPTTGTVRFKAVFDNHDLSLWPNQFVNIRLMLDVARMPSLFRWRRFSAERKALCIYREGRPCRPAARESGFDARKYFADCQRRCSRRSGSGRWAGHDCSRALPWKYITLHRSAPRGATGGRHPSGGHARWPAIRAPPAAAATEVRDPGPGKHKKPESRTDESVQAIYSSPGCHVSADGRDSAGWSRGLPAASGFRTAAG